MLVPFLFLFVSLSIGIYLNHIFNIYIPVYFPLILILISIFIKNKTGFVFLNLAVFILGLSISYEKQVKYFPENPIFVNCKVVSIPKNSFYGKSFDCLVKKSDFKEIEGKKIKTHLKSNDKEIFYFSNIAFLGNIKTDGNKVYGHPKKDFIKVDNSKNPFILIYRLKNYLIKNYKENSLNENSYQIGLPLIFGEKGFIPYSKRERFSETGLSHLLAISGLHVAILVISILFVLSFLKERIKYILIMGFLPFYAIFTGLQVPVLRASVMAGLYFFSKIKYLKINSLNILFFVGFLIILFSPEQLFNVGFQLSFIATFGIILGLDLVNIKTNLPKIINFLIQMLIVSFIATIFTLPLVLYYFGGFSFLSIIATPIAVLPLYPYLFLSVLNLITLMKIGFLVRFMDYFGILFLKIVNFFYGLHGYFQGFSPSPLIILIYLLLISFILILKFNMYKKVLVLFVSVFIFLFISQTKHKDFKVYTFKSKDYPSVLIFTPDRKGFLIGDYFNFKVRTTIKKENPLRIYLIYYKSKPYKIIQSLNLDFQNYFRIKKVLKIKGIFQIKKDKNRFILKIKNKTFILKNEDNFFILQN